MWENFKIAQKENHLIIIGEHGIDISLYISKIFSYNHKVLLLDLSSTGSILDIVSPYEHMDNHHIHYSKELISENAYDIIIIYSNFIKNIPQDLYNNKNDLYFVIGSSKRQLVRLYRDIKNIKDLENVFIVVRGSDEKETLLKRMFLLGIPYSIVNKTIFIKDNDNDTYVFRQMEYNSVFLYDKLTQEIRNFLRSIYQRRTKHNLIDEGRFKWVM